MTVTRDRSDAYLTEHHIFAVAMRHEDEGTDWIAIEVVFTTREAAEQYINEWEDEHDDTISGTHSFYQDDKGRKIPARCKKQREEMRPDWCPGCGEDRVLEEHVLYGRLSDLKPVKEGR